jgi:hypothetical protein
MAANDINGILTAREKISTRSNGKGHFAMTAEQKRMKVATMTGGKIDLPASRVPRKKMAPVSHA